MSQSIRISDLHEIGKSMSEQLIGREDRPATSQDLYNFALKVDTNFTLLKNDMATGFAINSQEFSNVRTEMQSEFKSVRAEMHSGFMEIRAEMKTGFDNVAHQFDNVTQEFVNVRAEMRNEMSGFKSSMIAWVASFGITIISVTSGLGVAILLKL